MPSSTLHRRVPGLESGETRRAAGMVCRAFLLFSVAALFCNCASTRRSNTQLVISATDQKMVVLKEGAKVKEYPVSTSKFGLGDQTGSYQTPLGKLKVADKIGGGLPAGSVFKSRRPTGEVLPVNAPGRDPIVTRIIWLSGTEEQNMNAFRRFIYIHGTPEERTIGRPASFGCIRMRSEDIIDLYNRLPVGSAVYVTTKRFESGGNVSAASAGQSRGAGGHSRVSSHGISEKVSLDVVKESDARIAAASNRVAGAEARMSAGAGAGAGASASAVSIAAKADEESAPAAKPAALTASAAETAETPKAAKRETESRRGPLGIFGRKAKPETASTGSAAPVPVVVAAGTTSA